MGNILEIKKGAALIEIGADSHNVNYNGSVPNVGNVNDALESLQSQINEFEPSDVINVAGKWVSVGTSITRQDADSNNGYQTKVRQVLNFSDFYNGGTNGAKISSAVSQLVAGDFYTIEFGVNDWRDGTTVGTLDDNFKADTGTGTFFGSYRRLIDAIYNLNQYAKIILCTPRKAYSNPAGLWPLHWWDENHGTYLKDYADAVIEIGKWMSLPVCDWFYESGMNQDNLALYSVDVAVHPNAAGHQQMANLLVQTFKKVLNCG